jgi:hypothetical protein
MESQGSLLCSQKPTIWSYPAPLESSVYLHTLLFQINFKLFFSEHLAFSSDLIPSGFVEKFVYVFLISLMHAICSSFLI